MRSKSLVLIICAILTAAAVGQSASSKPAQNDTLDIAVVGLVHGHIKGFFRNIPKFSNMRIVGIFESNQQVAKYWAKHCKMDGKLFYTDLEKMLDKSRPKAVVVFTNTFDHKKVIQACAERGIHVMVEKPLAVNMEHANAIEKAAVKNNIHVIVNYETTWYAGNHTAYSMIHEQKSIGDIRKIIFKAGHQGPKEIGCNEEFVQWLTDPVLNGGGASVDFGCYGANLMTWLMKGQKPTSVTAVTQHIKPKVYPKVDDEATILLTYPQAQGIIQASWNWPFNRKDMEVYGPNGYIHTVNGNDLKLRINNEREKQINTKKLKPPFDNSLSYFTAVVKKQIQPMGLSSLNNNMIVTEIIDAARRSAATGKTVHLKPQK